MSESRSPATSSPDVTSAPPADRALARASKHACETRFCKCTGVDFNLDGEWLCNACLRDSAIEDEAARDDAEYGE